MKRIRYGLAVWVLALLLTGGTHVYAAADTSTDFRAFWVSAAYNLDFPSKRGLSSQEMKKEIDALLDRAASLGLNAVIVQVRPASDALYNSALFPWSETLTGTQGQAPSGNFDPLAYWVEQAHRKGLELHAWINPFRITYASQKITDVKKLAATHPARQNPSWGVAYKDALYYDPGRPEVRQLIADGVSEILNNYAVDGIHLDDYFYPGTDFPDDATYRQYGSSLTKDDWRRENVNALIQLIQKTVRDINANVRYGVSPTAIWQNASSTPLGSNTRGYESYKSAYADTRRWVKEGWLDYICPQVYWHIGYEIADYEKVLHWWEDVCTGTGVDLYIGHAAYKEAESAANWPGSGEILRQLTMNAQSSMVRGSIFFRAGSLTGILNDQITAFFRAKDSAAYNPAPNVTNAPLPIIPVPDAPSQTAASPAISNVNNIVATPSVVMNKLTVAQPADNLSISDAQGYTVLGTCIPGLPLYVNGQPVVNRTSEGFFSYYAPLTKGDNRFTFSQDGQPSVTRTITLKDAAITYPSTMKAPAISNAYPEADEMASAGDTITLKCTAPADAKVTARINGTTVTLNQDNAWIKNNGSTLYAASYSGVYVIPEGNAGRIDDLGKPVYSMEFNGKTDKATAKGAVQRIGYSAPYYATVTANSAWIYPKATTNGGSAWQLLKGQKDRVTAVTSNGTWARLASGAWIEAAYISLAWENTAWTDVLSNGVYISGIDEDIVLWNTAVFPAIVADFDGKQLTVRLGLQQSLPGYLQDAWGTLFVSINASVVQNVSSYTFTLRDGAQLEGFYVDYANGELRLHLKKRKTLAQGLTPLAGFTFVVDAGHGGTENGALGPMGKAIAEKDINLANAQKLTARLTQLGAKVIMVRSTDATFKLSERTDINWAVNPDIFISMHANSMPETTDSSEIRGLTVWYRNAGSMPLANTLAEQLFMVNPRTTRRTYSNQSNFYVCRPAWAPSVIIESSFMCNVDDFAWLINERHQNELADAIASAILAYYRAP